MAEEPLAGVPRPGIFEACRVKHWAHFLLLPLAGLQAPVGVDERLMATGRGVLIAGCVLAFGYLLNGVADRDMDDATKNPLSVAPERRWGGLLLGLATTAVVLAATGPWVTLAATLLVLTSGVVYSIGPRLKRYPVLGTLTNATHFTPLLWMGLPTTGATSAVVVLTQAFVLLLIQNQLFHEAADRHDDVRGDVNTTYLRFGRKRCAVAVAVLGALLAGLCAMTGLTELGIVAAVVFTLLAPLAMGLYGDDETRMGHARSVHRLSSLAWGAWLFAAT